MASQSSSSKRDRRPSSPHQNSTPPYYNASKPSRQCVDCKKPPTMQCLHCSKYVCMECAQKHVALANEQVDVAQHVLNSKLNILDRLSAEAKERISAESNRIVQQADAERKRAVIQIDQLVEQQKKLVREKNTQLSQLSLDEIPTFIQQMTSGLEYISETNKQLFSVTSTMPKIHVQNSYDQNHSFTMQSLKILST